MTCNEDADDQREGVVNIYGLILNNYATMNSYIFNSYRTYNFAQYISCLQQVLFIFLFLLDIIILISD